MADKSDTPREIQRYSMTLKHAWADCDGPWVAWEDHQRGLAALKAEIELMRPVVEAAIGWSNDTAQEYNLLLFSVDKYKARTAK